MATDSLIVNLSLHDTVDELTGEVKVSFNSKSYEMENYDKMCVQELCEEFQNVSDAFSCQNP